MWFNVGPASWTVSLIGLMSCVCWKDGQYKRVLTSKRLKSCTVEFVPWSNPTGLDAPDKITSALIKTCDLSHATNYSYYYHYFHIVLILL